VLNEASALHSQLFCLSPQSQSTGSAYQTGELKVGHIILEIDGLSTANMNHSEVAQLLANAYYTNPSKYLELVVRGKNKNELDLRRNSFMLLNNSYE
jgi:C-terminal processing protease CtpA/Prc